MPALGYQLPVCFLPICGHLWEASSISPKILCKNHFMCVSHIEKKNRLSFLEAWNTSILVIVLYEDFLPQIYSSCKVIFPGGRWIGRVGLGVCIFDKLQSWMVTHYSLRIILIALIEWKVNGSSLGHALFEIGMSSRQNRDSNF